MNQEQINFARAIAKNPANEDTDMKILVQVVLNKYPELTYDEVYSVMFRAVIGM